MPHPSIAKWFSLKTGRSPLATTIFMGCIGTLPLYVTRVQREPKQVKSRCHFWKSLSTYEKNEVNMAHSSNSRETNQPVRSGEFSRRDILKYSAGTFAAFSMSSLPFGCSLPVNGSCNAELFKQLSPQMVTHLKTMFP